MNARSDEASASATIELDANIGLLMHAVTTHGQSCAIVSAAVRALLDAFHQREIAQHTKVVYAKAFVETGGYGALWGQLATYVDREEFQLSGLELLRLVMEIIGEDQDVTFPVAKDLLDAASLICRAGINYNRQDSLLRLVQVLEKLVCHLNEPSDYTTLIDIVTRIMVAPGCHLDVLVSCLECISLVVSLADARGSQVELGASTMSVIGKILSANVNQVDYHERSFVPLAIAALPTVLSICDHSNKKRSFFSYPVISAVLFAASTVRDLSEFEARPIEGLIGDPFRYVVKQFFESIHAEDGAIGISSAFVGVVRNLSFALLWSSHATIYLEMNGLSPLIDVIERSVESKCVELASASACALHHLSSTVPKRAVNTLEGDDAVNRLVRCCAPVVELDSDELLDHLLAVITSLADVDRFGVCIVESGGLDFFLAILHRQIQLPRACRRTVELLGRLYAARANPIRVTVDVSFIHLLNEFRRSMGDQAHDGFQTEYIRALAFAWDHCTEAEFMEGAPKDLVRMMRTKVENAAVFAEACELVLRLVKHPTNRLELIDSGIVQVAAKAIYLHDSQSLQRSLSSILMHTLHVVDGTRNASILQTLVQMWKQSLTPPSDMDTFVESLELNCYVLAAITRLTSWSSSLPLVAVRSNLCRLLRNNIDDCDRLSSAAFARISRCVVYALQRFTRQRGSTGTSTDARVIGDTVTNDEASDNVLPLIIDTVAKLIGQPGEVESSATLCCCQFAWELFSTFSSNSDTNQTSRWMSIALKILSDHKCESVLMEPVLCSITAIIARLGKSPIDSKSGGIFSVLVGVLKRLAGKKMRVSETSLTLALQCLKIVSWNPAFRSHALNTACLVAIHQLLDGFTTIPTAVLERCISITRALSTDAYIEHVITSLRMWTQDCVDSGNRLPLASKTDRFGDLCASITVILVADQQTPILKKKRHRQRIVEFACQLPRNIFNGSNRITKLLDGCAPCCHWLPEADQFKLIETSLRSGQETPLLWVFSISKWNKTDWCINALTEAMARCFQTDSIRYFASLCDCLTFVLQYVKPSGQNCDIILTETSRRAISAMCESALRLLMSRSEGSSWDVQAVATVIATQACLIQGDSSMSALGIDISRLAMACLQALTECLFRSSIASVDESISRSYLFRSLLSSSSVVLHAYVAEGAEQARELLQDPAIQQLLMQDSSSFGDLSLAHSRWCTALVGFYIQEHGLIFGEKILKLIPYPAWIVANALGNSEVLVQDAHDWRSLLDCIAVRTDCNGWGQLPMQAHVDLAGQAMSDILHKAGRRSLCAPSLVHAVVNSAVTRLSLVFSCIRLELYDARSTVIEELLDSCLQVARLSQELYESSSLFSELQFTAIAQMILEITKCVLAGVSTQRREAIVIEFAQFLVKPSLVQTSTLAAYLELATHALLGDSTNPSLGRLLEPCLDIVRIITLDADMLQGNTTGRPFRAVKLTFTAIASCFQDERTAEDMAQLVKVVEACASSGSAQELLWLALFKLADGVDILLQVAATCQQQTTAENIVMFLHRQSAEVRHKSVHIGEREMELVLDLMRSNVAVGVDRFPVPFDQIPCRTARSFAVIESTLSVLKLFVRAKGCAVACSRAGGFQVLYDLLSSSVQDEGSVLLTLEICCFLTSHEESLSASSAVFPLVKLLCLMTDLPERSHTLARLALVILDQCVTLARTQFTYSLTQIARSHLWKWKGQCSEEEISEVMKKLNPLHVQLSKERNAAISDSGEGGKMNTPDGKQKITEEENAIRETISRFFSVVHIPGSNSDARNSYINVKTSVKTDEPSSEYSALHAALYHVRDNLHDPAFFANHDFAREILPSVSGIVILHASSTTDVVCVAMEIVSNFSYIVPQDVLVQHIDASGLLGSCYLHIARSLQFALHAASFCENLVVDVRADVTRTCRPLLQLVFALMKHHPEDFDITQSCMSCLRDLLTKVGPVVVVSMQEHSVQRMVEVLCNHAHDISVTWKAVVCLQQLAPRVGPLRDRDLVDALAALLNVVVANTSHAFLARMALTAIDALEQRDPTTARQTLLEMDAVGILVDIIGIHLDDVSIVSTSLRLLLRMLTTENHDTLAAALASLVEKNGHTTILAVSRCHVDSISICALAFELLLMTIEAKETSVLPDMSAAAETPTWHDRVLGELFAHDIVQLILDTFQTSFGQPDSTPLLVLLLEVLCDILSTQSGRVAMERINGLTHLRQIIDMVWDERQDVRLLESALDCLVNVACSTHFDVVWTTLPEWLTTLADRLHEQEVSPSSVEKIVGILLRLSVHPSIANEITRSCSQTLLQMLVLVGDNTHLEVNLLALLSQLCFEPKSVPMLIIFDAITSLLERIAFHLESDHEAELYSCLCLVATMASNKECFHAFQLKALHVLIASVTENSRSSARVQQVAHEIKDRIPSPGGSSLRKMTTAEATRVHALSASTKPASLRQPEPLSSGGSMAESVDNFGDHGESNESSHREILWRGAVFRMRRDPKQTKKRDKVVISLGESEEYLLLRNLGFDPPTVERVFLSQIQVLPNTKAVTAEDKLVQKTSALSPRPQLRLKALSIPSLVRSVSRAECIFHLMIKKELVSLEATTPKERRAWEDALQWILQQQNVAS